VEGELGMGLNVGVPAPTAWGAGYVEPAIQVVIMHWKNFIFLLEEN